LQKLWFEIEALALARESTEELIDLTEPNVERIEGRIGKYLREYVEMFNLTDVGSGKRKAAPNGESAAAKKAKTGDEAIDVAAEARAGRVNIYILAVRKFQLILIHDIFKLEKLTVPILKDFIKDKKISAKGTKKEDLVKSIKTFLKI
jgi:ATP-dependent DNA helicase 2 subunit 1